MKFKKNSIETGFDIFNVVFMIVLMLVTVYPILYILFASVSDAGLLMQHRGFLLVPLGVNFDSYIAVFKNPLILTGFRNTLFVVIVGSAVNILMTFLAAYFLSRKKLLWKRFVMIMIVITMFFGGGMIPSYLVVVGLGLRNSLWSLIIPSAVSAFNIIVMRTAFMSIPESLEESAVLDGANDFTILFRIIVPLSLPVTAVMLLWYGVGHWNAWFQASLFLSNRKLFPLQLILREVLIQNTMDEMLVGTQNADRGQVAETIKYATIIVATIPILFVYPFLQKYFVKGVMIGALKG